MKHIIGIVGTNSKKSTNRKLLKYIQKHFADQAEIELLEIRDYPIFTKPEDKTLP
ncbi:NADPH-dependent FMN reductase, partial [Aerococcus urinaeequi]